MPSPSTVAEQLAESQRLFGEMGPDFLGVKHRVAELNERLVQGRFRLAVLGQFKRGKSTLLNALLGEALLPAGVLPLTAVPTILRPGSERLIRIVFTDGREEQFSGSIERLSDVLTQYATERGNPGNRRQVDEITVEHPCSLLQNGLEIIDTPGVGSTILQNTQAARAALPLCDAALVVLSPDPPITEVEVNFLSAIKAVTVRVVFVLSKADLVVASARDEIMEFVRRTISEQAGFSGQEPLFAVSALQGLTARLQDDRDLWRRSGLVDLESYLADFLIFEKREALETAIRRKAAHLIGEAQFTVALQRNIVELPRHDLQRRAERFEEQLSTLHEERMYLHDQLRGDQARLLKEVESLTEAVSAQAEKELRSAADTMRAKSQGVASGVSLYRHVQLHLSDEIRRVFSQERGELVHHTTRRVQSIQDGHCHKLNRLLHRIRQTAADLFEVPYLEQGGLPDIERLREPTIIPQQFITSFVEQTAAWLVQWLPAYFRDRYLERQLYEDIRYLAIRNAGELRWALQQNLDDIFRRLATGLDEQLDDAIRVIRQSIENTLSRQANRESVHGPEVQGLSQYGDALSRLHHALASGAVQTSYGPPV